MLEGGLRAALLAGLRDSSIKMHQLDGHLAPALPDPAERELAAVALRREFTGCPAELPLAGFDYGEAAGACCENMVGFIGIPVGVAGPLTVDGRPCLLPLATTEGALVASVNRGCRAVAGGVTTAVLAKGMTRGPLIKLPSLARAAEVKRWVDAHWQPVLAPVFEATSRHLRLAAVRTTLAGRYLFLRFKADTGEAMGMNMVSKAAQAATEHLLAHVCPDALLSCLSGNYCTDKKAGAALNWADGRGYSVAAEAVVSPAALRTVLKVAGGAAALAELATAKNLIGSAAAGVAAGGQNAQAANLVAALFLACGQDPAQVVGSAACLTICEAEADGSLRISCTLPCLEVGVVGGGTRLAGQRALVQQLTAGLPEGARAEGLARIIAAAVLVGELSLLAALCEGSLVRSHLALNRRPPGGPA